MLTIGSSIVLKSCYTLLGCHVSCLQCCI